MKFERGNIEQEIQQFINLPLGNDLNLAEMQSILEKYSQEIISKAKDIKVIITDVDGVLTDGKIIYDDNGLEYKEFFVRDGQIMRFLRDANIKTGVITGRKSQVVINRCNELKFDFHHHGAKDKMVVWDEVINNLKVEAVNVAYIGDDLLDLPLFKKAGLSAAPFDAPDYVKSKADVTTTLGGGKGAFREFSDLILAAQSKWDDIFRILDIRN